MIINEFWNDPYIEGLKKDYRYLFLYLCTNKKAEVCGLYEISLKMIKDESILDTKTIISGLEKFQEDKKIFYQDNIIFIRKYALHQKAENLGKFQEHIENNYKKLYNENNLAFKIFCFTFNDLLKHLFNEPLKNSLLTVQELLKDKGQGTRDCGLGTKDKGLEKISRPILFRDSIYFDKQKFIEDFETNDYKFFDGNYYYESALNWSNSGNKKKINWVATAKNWALRDLKDGKPKLKKEYEQKYNQSKGFTTPRTESVDWEKFRELLKIEN